MSTVNSAKKKAFAEAAARVVQRLPKTTREREEIRTLLVDEENREQRTGKNAKEENGKGTKKMAL